MLHAPGMKGLTPQTLIAAYLMLMVLLAVFVRWEYKRLRRQHRNREFDL